MHEPSPSTIAGFAVGGTSLSFPWWSDAVTFATGANQWLIAIGGLLVLFLTIRKLLIENKIASRRLKDMDGGQ
jgi:hypothetical protein